MKHQDETQPVAAGEAALDGLRLIEQAEADAGLLISQADMNAWIDSLGTANPLPPPEPPKRSVDAQSEAEIARNVAEGADAAPIRTAAERASALARTVRKRLGISQAEFAARFHVPLGTLRDWEQNRKQLDAPALAYLRVIAREPAVVARALQREDR